MIKYNCDINFHAVSPNRFVILFLLWFLHFQNGVTLIQPHYRLHRSTINLYSTRIPDIGGLREWFAFEDCQVLFHSTSQARLPKSIIHFTGGFLLGSASPVAYNDLFQQLSSSGHLVVATTIPPFDSNHTKTATDISRSFNKCYSDYLLPMMGPYGKKIPVIGLSHSLGGKLMALVASRREDRRSSPIRAGNIFMAFNNYGFQKSLELSAKASGANARSATRSNEDRSSGSEFNVQGVLDAVKSSAGILDGIAASFSKSTGSSSVDSLINAAKRIIPQEQMNSAASAVSSAASALTDFEFTPSPEDTWKAILQGYGVDNNVLFKFQDDDIDQSEELAGCLVKRGGCRIAVETVPGTHLTPCSDDDLFFRCMLKSLNKLAMEWTENQEGGLDEFRKQRMLGSGQG